MELYAPVRRMLLRAARRIFRRHPQTLVRLLDAGLLDPTPSESATPAAPPRPFDSVRSLNVFDWARRKGADLRTRSLELTIVAEHSELGLFYAEGPDSGRYLIDATTRTDFMPRVGLVMLAEVTERGYVVSARLANQPGRGS